MVPYLMGTAAGTAVRFGHDVSDGFVNTAKGVADGIGNAYGVVANGASHVISGAGQVVGSVHGAVQNGIDTVTSIPGNIAKGVSDLGHKAISGIQDWITGIKGDFNKGFQTGYDDPTKMGRDVAKAVNKNVEDFKQGIQEGWRSHQQQEPSVYSPIGGDVGMRRHGHNIGAEIREQKARDAERRVGTGMGVGEAGVGRMGADFKPISIPHRKFDMSQEVGVGRMSAELKPISIPHSKPDISHIIATGVETMADTAHSVMPDVSSLEPTKPESPDLGSELAAG